MTLADLMEWSNQLQHGAFEAQAEGNVAVHIRLAQAALLVASAMRHVRPAPDLHGNRECAEVA